MVVNGLAFKDTVNGRERTTDGLWTHRGAIRVTGGPVDLPAGSIGTAELSPGAVSAVIGEFNTSASYATPDNNVWHETPINITGTFTGARCRIEYSVPFQNNFASGISNVGIGFDGTIYWHLSAWHHAVAGYLATASGTVYGVLPPGSHRVGVFFNAASGQMSIYGISSTLYVTDQRA